MADMDAMDAIPAPVDPVAVTRTHERLVRLADAAAKIVDQPAALVDILTALDARYVVGDGLVIGERLRAYVR